MRGVKCRRMGTAGCFTAPVGTQKHLHQPANPLSVRPSRLFVVLDTQTKDETMDGRKTGNAKAERDKEMLNGAGRNGELPGVALGQEGEGKPGLPRGGGWWRGCRKCSAGLARKWKGPEKQYVFLGRKEGGGGGRRRELLSSTEKGGKGGWAVNLEELGRLCLSRESRFHVPHTPGRFETVIGFCHWLVSGL